MDNSYIESMRSHIKQLQAELDGLSQIAQKQSLGRYEYRAAERTLQITIEACIGIAKHWCKQLEQVAPTSAYLSFERLQTHNIKSVKNIQWKRIIGMKNALVHDYLNIDPKVIEHVLVTKLHHPLIDFANEGLEALSKN